MENQPKNPLITSKEYISPTVIIELFKQGFIDGSEAARLYIATSIISLARQNKPFYLRTKFIAQKLSITPELVRQAVSRQNKIIRDGRNGQRGRRWIVIGINEHIQKSKTSKKWI